MLIYKLIHTYTDEHGHNMYRIRYGHSITLVSHDFVMVDFGCVLTPVYDSTTRYLIGFTD